MQTQEQIIAEFQAAAAADVPSRRPERPRPKSRPTWTHVGWLGMRAYQSFESYWHGDGPRPLKRHACNPARDGDGYRTLCGKRIVPPSNGGIGSGDFFEGDHAEATAVVPAGESAPRVTCRTCRRKMEGR